MTILTVNYPEVEQYLNDKWIEGLWVVDTSLEDALENYSTYEPDYIICSTKDDAQQLGGFWHEDFETIKEICDGIT